ncbi:MAG: dehydratase [Chloroflexi bacterium]|nr:dehydratase [Chloroflexota bacterium]
MSAMLYYEDVHIGDELPTLTKHPTTQQLVKYAGASGDFYQIHYDKDFALGLGLPGVILHGLLKAAFLGQLLTDWIGVEGFIKEFDCSYRGMDVPGQPLYCKGRVTNKFEEGNEHCIECDIWTENPGGEHTTPGKAVVVLPRRS